MLEPLMARGPDPDPTFRYPTRELVLRVMGRPAASCAGAKRATDTVTPSRNGAVGMNAKPRESAVHSKCPATRASERQTSRFCSTEARSRGALQRVVMSESTGAISDWVAG